MSYTVFIRSWWKSNKSWPNGLEPHAGKRTTIAHVETQDEARDLCRTWNANHAPGRFSRKAEYTS